MLAFIKRPSPPKAEWGMKSAHLRQPARYHPAVGWRGAPTRTEGREIMVASVDTREKAIYHKFASITSKQRRGCVKTAMPDFRLHQLRWDTTTGSRLSNFSKRSGRRGVRQQIRAAATTRD